MLSKDLSVDLMHRHNSLLSLRSPYEPAWRDLAAHFLPTRYYDAAQNPDGYKQSPLLNNNLVDATGILAIRTLAAGLQGGMTSPARPWFQLSLEDAELANHAPVKSWLADVARYMRTVFARSNFYHAVHNMYGDLGTFGTAFMLELADFDNGFRFVPFSAGEYAVDVNARQKIDVVFRRFQMSARQMVQQFGKDKVPSYVLDCANKKRNWNSYDDRFTVVHAIFPRNDYKHDHLRTGKGMPFASIYYMDSITGAHGSGRYSSAMVGHILSESGFDNFPGFGVRWDVHGVRVYGNSPAMDVLPDCRMLQQMGISTLKAIHKSVEPPTAVTASLKSVGLDLTPGGVNYVETQPGQSPQAATPILQIRPEIAEARGAIAEVQNQIKQGLYNDLFRLLMDSNRRQITAKEVATREEEKLILIGPVLERLHDEFFIPLIERTFSLMLRHNMLPPMPDAIVDQEIKIEFVSLLAQAQKLVSTSAVDNLIGFVLSSAPIDQQIVDAINLDKVVDEYSDYLGVDPSMVRPQDEREQMREQRAQAMQAQAQAEQQAAMGAQAVQGMQGAATAAQKLAATPLDENSALDALIGGMGGM